MISRLVLIQTLACVLLTSVSLGAGLGFDPEGDPTPAASMYIAPENALIFRMRQPDGSFRQFERYVNRPGFLRGAEGWTGRLEGGAIVIMTPAGYRPEVVYGFDRGVLKWYSCDGKTNDLTSVVRPTLSADESPLNYEDPTVTRKNAENHRFDLWRNRQRLQFPFLNPNRNGVFYVQILLLGLALLLVKRRSLAVVGTILTLVSTVAMLMTASRGAFLACGVAVLPILILGGRRLISSRWLWVALALIVAFGSIWFATHDGRLLTRGFKKTSWSNRVRMDLAKVAPRMMADAPGGWGFADAGHAYVNWYQPLDVWCLTGSMMNDHLTVAVSTNRLVRVAYVFGWLLVLGLLGGFAIRRRDAVPLGLWTSMAVAATFNPVMGEWTLWLAPAGALVLVAGKGYRVLCRRDLVVIGGVAAVVAALVVFGVEWFGSMSPQKIPVRVADRRVLVNGTNPLTWIVDDGVALAGPFAGKDIRTFYESCPQAPAVGYVKSVDDLPDAGVRHLVLAGYSGDAWLRKISSSPDFQRALPSQVSFISPPFPPAAVPPPLLSACRVKLYVGEFVARYGEAYANPPDWVTFVPGCEQYLLRWMSLLW